jgi:hypothetical protein
MGAGDKTTTGARGHGVTTIQGQAIARAAVRDTSDPRVILHSLNNDPSHILYVLDGEKMPEGWKADSIPPDLIAAIDVVKGEQAVRLYGERGVNGAIAILLKDYELHLELKDSLRLSDKNATHDGRVAATMNTKDGPMTIIGDTLRINKP